MRKVIALIAIYIATANMVISNSIISVPNNLKQHLNQLPVVIERGLEIRYYVLISSAKNIPTVITIENKSYDLYKSKTEAINAIKNATLKKDFSIVYVISEQAKETEYVVIDDEK